MRKDTDSRRGKPTTTPGRDAAESRRQKSKPAWDGTSGTDETDPATRATEDGTLSGQATPTFQDTATDPSPGTLYPSGGAATRDSADDLIAERTDADERPDTDTPGSTGTGADRPLNAEFRTGTPRADRPWDSESRTSTVPGADSRADDEPRLLASGDTLPEEPVPGVSDTRTATDREVDAARSGHHGADAARESGLDGHPTADLLHRAGGVEDTHWAHGGTDPAHGSGVVEADPGPGGPVPEEPTAIGSAKVPGAMTPDLRASDATADPKTFGTATHDTATGATTHDAVSPKDAVEPSPTPAEPARRLWTAGTSEGLHERWQALQLRFVDDPSAVAGEARTLVDEAIRTLTAELTHRQRELDAWNDGTSPDTEQLRVAVQKYRDFFTFLLTR
ncbi:hypothetical protein AB0M43_13910 [Longispora sp. NPDC051575]|uniref:hypothetical protein n=1 Tax=Longispora sp. NPDC051575 TaxID=3154943 RepID=UPI003427CB2A